MMGLGSKDGLALIATSLLGYLLGQALPGAWNPYASILISYHLYLAWLLLTANHKTGISLPIVYTTMTHLCCVALVVILAVGRQYVPFFAILRFFVPALAPFERAWLFSGGTPKKEIPIDDLALAAAVGGTAAAAKAAAAAAKAAAAKAAAAKAAAVPVVTAEDYEAWLCHLKKRNPLARKPGMTMKDEYEQWMAARFKARAAAVQKKQPA
jgi:uncharacterized short protein YbdD (DUF466 family)